MILVCILCIVSVILLYVLFILVYPTLVEFKPENEVILIEKQELDTRLPINKEYSVLTWNIGYAGLGKEMDFFYEGGEMVRPSKEFNKTYLEGITDFIQQNDSLDFFLIQEVDFNSARSYKTDQFKVLSERLPSLKAVSATNYKSPFVPSPILDPMGKVDAGQATLSSSQIAEAMRFATPGSYSWPMRLYMLKRCFLVTKYPLDNGKDLIIFNIHNSAFDDASDLRGQELALLRKMIIEEYNKGNYVIIGGDWNQNPPEWKMPESSAYKLKSLWPIEDDYFPKDWNWAFDGSLPTNRDVDKPFQKNSTSCTLLDYFLVSPNIDIQHIETIDLGFSHSDHLPVVMRFILK